MLIVHNTNIIQDQTAEIGSYITDLMFTQQMGSPLLINILKGVKGRLKLYEGKKATVANCKQLYSTIEPLLATIKSEEFIKKLPSEYEDNRAELQEAIEELLDSIHSGFEKPYGVSDEEWLDIISVSENQPTHPYQGFKNDGTVEGYIKSEFSVLSKRSVVGFYNSGYYNVAFKTAMNIFNAEHPEAWEMAKKDDVIARRITNYLTTTVLDTFCYVCTMQSGPYRPAIHSWGNTPQNWERITSWEQIISGKHLTYNEILGIYEDDEAVSSAVVEVSVNQEQKVAV